jgi:hypothetical protein
MENLEFIKSLTPKDVLETWRNMEENLEHWKGFWHSKGFKSWQEWRETSHAPLFKKQLNWSLYKVNEPLKSVPEWRAGMFHAWNKWFYVNFPEKPPRLKDLLSHPGINNHWYVREIANNFFSPTTLTALRMPNGDIVIAEGMHRACAITLIAHNNKPLNAEVFVMMADWPENEPPRLGTGWDKN